MKQDQHKGRTIFSRLLLAFAGVVILISATLTAVFSVFNTKSIERRTRENIFQQFVAIQSQFGYELRDNVVQDLRLLSSNPVLDEFMMSSELEKEINARAVERLFLESLKHGKRYERITFVNVLGREIIAVDRRGRARDYRDRSGDTLFAQMKSETAGRIHATAPRADERGGVSFTAGINKIDADIGKFGGAVLIECTVNDFFEAVENVKIFDENPLWIFAPDGRAMKQPKAERARFDPRPHLGKGVQPVPELVTVDGGMVLYQDLFIIPQRPLLRLAISIPSSLLLEDLRSVLRFFSVVFLASLALISMIAYYLAGYFSRPITKLAQAAGRLAQGDLSTRVEVATTGEVQALVDSFNRMSEDLQRTTVSKDYVDNIIKSMRDTLIVVAPDGSISRVNAAACLLLGYEENELVGRPAERVFGSEGTGAGPGTVDVLLRGSRGTVETTYRAKDGTRVPVLFSAAVMHNAQGADEGIVCVAQDITERKWAEAQLKAYSDELVEINEELKSFAYIVSHDLRAPLVNIKGFSQEFARALQIIEPVFERHCAQLAEKERQRVLSLLKKDIPTALTFISSSVTRMDNLISAVLKVSRAGRRKLNPEPLQMDEVVRGILNTLAHQIGSRRITVTVAPLPPVVADRAALEQVFGNLLDNAIKYLEADRPGIIVIGAEQGDREITFQVRDNGRGMAPEDIPRAFELFRRVGKQDVPGEGIGLAYVKALVRLLGGRIWCESEPGGGTMFSFTVPATPEQHRRDPGGEQRS